VLGTLIAVLAAPPPLSEYPLPEWNRAAASVDPSSSLARLV
jgi:hypothetical protein